MLTLTFLAGLGLGAFVACIGFMLIIRGGAKVSRDNKEQWQLQLCALEERNNLLAEQNAIFRALAADNNPSE